MGIQRFDFKGRFDVEATKLARESWKAKKGPPNRIIVCTGTTRLTQLSVESADRPSQIKAIKIVIDDTRHLTTHQFELDEYS